MSLVTIFAAVLCNSLLGVVPAAAVGDGKSRENAVSRMVVVRPEGGDVRMGTAGDRLAGLGTISFGKYARPKVNGLVHRGSCSRFLLRREWAPLLPWVGFPRGSLRRNSSR